MSLFGTELALPVTLAIVALLLYFYLSKGRHTYWSDRGVKGPTPVPFIGNIWRLITRQINNTEYATELYFKYKKDRFCGVYVTKMPLLIITDNELMYRMCSQDMPYFESHGLKVELDKNPLSANLFNMSGPHWKNLRSKMTPTFTTGKMKAMYGVMEHTGTLLQNLLEEPARKEDSVEILEVLARFTTDVIGNVAFGLDINSIDNEHSQFRIMGKRVFRAISFKEVLMGLVARIIPMAHKVLPTRESMKDVIDFFVKVITDVVEYREKNNVHRSDFLDLLIKLKNNKLTDDQGNAINLSDKDSSSSFTISHEELMSQVFVFFLAGFETSSSTSAFALYSMALNPDVQEKTRENVLRTLEKHGGKYTYEALAEMEYLANVINETLRKHPVVNVLFRQCTADYKIPDTNVKIDKGTMVFMPLGGLHNDPELWENPDKFDPDRFLPERKPDNLNRIYMPFGQGPRICIGQRFGLLQSKLALAKLLAKYRFEPSALTKIPMEYVKPGSTPNLAPAGGVHLAVRPL